jgi:hypothetical protein
MDDFAADTDVCASHMDVSTALCAAFTRCSVAFRINTYSVDAVRTCLRCYCFSCSVGRLLCQRRARAAAGTRPCDCICSRNRPPLDRMYCAAPVSCLCADVLHTAARKWDCPTNFDAAATNTFRCCSCCSPSYASHHVRGIHCCAVAWHCLLCKDGLVRSSCSAFSTPRPLLCVICCTCSALLPLLASRAILLLIIVLLAALLLQHIFFLPLVRARMQRRMQASRPDAIDY